MSSINHPKYYQKDGKECIDVMSERWTLLATLIFCWLNRFKYCWRAGLKVDGSTNDIQDTKKADWYSQYYYSHFNQLTWFQKFIAIKVLHLPKPTKFSWWQIC